MSEFFKALSHTSLLNVNYDVDKGYSIDYSSGDLRIWI